MDSIDKCSRYFSGSVDEKEDEQGIAHIVEHVTFLGSTRRDQLLGTGARSNAYTDFHHTVFHVHSPLFNNNVRNSGPMLPQVGCPLLSPSFAMFAVCYLPLVRWVLRIPLHG